MAGDRASHRAQADKAHCFHANSSLPSNRGLVYKFIAEARWRCQCKLRSVMVLHGTSLLSTSFLMPIGFDTRMAIRAKGELIWDSCLTANGTTMTKSPAM